MHPMQGSAGENEQQSPEAEGPVEQDLRWEIIVGIIIPVVAAVLLQYVARRDPDSVSFKLQGLHYTIKVLQTVARTTGQWALTAENFYNETVTALH